jgi:hypothetical protein
MTAEFEEPVLRRIVWISVALAIAGAIVAYFKYGPANAAGFLAGSTLSIVSFHGLRRMVRGIGGPSTGPSTALFALRYFLVGGAVYVIVKSLEITAMPVLAGLFVAAAAVIVEILYELIYART